MPKMVIKLVLVFHLMLLSLGWLSSAILGLKKGGEAPRAKKGLRRIQIFSLQQFQRSGRSASTRNLNSAALLQYRHAASRGSRAVNLSASCRESRMEIEKGPAAVERPIPFWKRDVLWKEDFSRRASCSLPRF